MRQLLDGILSWLKTTVYRKNKKPGLEAGLGSLLNTRRNDRMKK